MVDKTNLKSETRATAMTISHLADGGGVFPFSGAKNPKMSVCRVLQFTEGTTTPAQAAEAPLSAFWQDL